MKEFKEKIELTKNRINQAKTSHHYFELKKLFLNNYKPRKQNEIDNKIFSSVGLAYSVGSILFDKTLRDLYLSIYSLGKKEKSEDEIKAIFSCWFIINKLKILLQPENNNNEKIKNFKDDLEHGILKKTNLQNKKYKEDVSFKRIHGIITKNVSKFTDVLFQISNSKRKKNLNEPDLNEEKIFDQNYYDLYSIMKNILKVEFLTISFPILEEILKKFEFSQQEIVTIREINSIIKNDSQFSFQLAFKNKNSKKKFK